MEEELISKKELLDLTGISYGQLYRWKRKNLVPEEWFIRKSAFTGQETFFPKQRMLARIDKILNMKDGLSLDELADIFSPSPAQMSIPAVQLIEQNIVSKSTADYARPYIGSADIYTFEQTLFLYLLDCALQTGQMSLDEGQALLSTLAEHYARFEGRNCDLIFIRKMGLSVFLLVTAGTDIFTESGSKLVFRQNVAKHVEELKLKLSAG
ncbi:YhbD family protein [Paenibacillus sp. NPDC058071]|uniref:YhbD family protein n=1 Tax=Paenibacillus sp. NPDC058071 TaxID=3346326 RepID=UPI0036DEBC80